MGEVEKRTQGFTPPEKTIIVKPIMRPRNTMIDDPEHEAYFLVGNSRISYCLPQDRYGNLLNPFTNDGEREWLEKELDVDLNIHKSRDNYWHKYKVALGKDSRKLNLRDPKHYLEYIMLKMNRLYIAPDGENIPDKATYRYALVSEEFETKQTEKKADQQIEGYMTLGKLREDRDGMVNFLKVYGRKVSDSSKTSFLVAELKKIIETDLGGFLAITRDKENYDMKLLIAQAVEAGAIQKHGRKYHLPGGDDLCGPGDVPTIENVVAYLKSPGNQDMLTMLKARINNAKE